MKKIVVAALLLTTLLLSVSCGQRTCFDCGKPIGERGYEAFGNSYCEDCFI